MESINILLVAGIFFILLVVLAVFVAQQLTAVSKTRAKDSMTLSEKLAASGIAPLDTDRFREIAMKSGPVEENPSSSVDTGVQKPFDQSSGFGLPREGTFETPEEAVFTDPNISPDIKKIEEKELQTLYSEYLTAKSLSPFDMEPDFKLGLAYLKNVQYGKAQDLFQKVIESKPDFPGIYYYLGESFRCNGQFYEAMQAYKQSWESEHLETESRKDKVQDTVEDKAIDADIDKGKSTKTGE